MAAKIGWILSAVILVVLLVFLTIVYWPARTVGTPTELTARLDKIEMNLDLEKLMPVPQGTGAEALYEECVRDALKTLKPGESPFHFYERLRSTETANPMQVEDLKPILDKLVKASEMGMDPKVELEFAALPMQGSTDKGNELFLKGLGHVLDKAAVAYLRESKYPEAIRMYNATAIFGWRLWKQGVYAGTRTAGLSPLGDGVAGLVLVYRDSGDKEKQAVATEQDRIRTTAAQAWMEKIRWTRSIEQNKGKIGDLANMAVHDKDRSWRIQGVMWLGIAKWTSTNSSGRRQIDAFLEEQTRSKDPLFVAAAKTAKAYSKEELQQFDARPFVNY